MRRESYNVIRLLVLLLSLSGGTLLSHCMAQDKYQTDILVVGGGASGVAAGIQASRMGAKVLIVEETPWLGGMLTSAGVSAVDGNYNLRAGFWGEFLDSLQQHYGSLAAMQTGWVSNVLFEPSVGDKILKSIVAKEKNLRVEYGYFPQEVSRDADGLWMVGFSSDKDLRLKVSARMLIDATELGDIAAMVGIPFDVGMESRNLTGESIAPLEGNNIIQDLTYVATLKDYGHPSYIDMPANYNPALYKCSCINPLCDNPLEPKRMQTPDMMLSYGRLPNGKYMLNWPIEGNDCYLNIIEYDHNQRIEALKKAKDITLGMVYFIQHELGFSNISLADDEFPTSDRLPFIPYHRESRRIKGKIRFTFNDARDPYSNNLYRTNIAVGDYPVDHHHKRYDGLEKLPDLHFYPIPAYGLPLGTMLPQIENHLIVAEKSISVSNIINGTTRLQPVVLQIGTAAGALAALWLREGHMPTIRSVQKVVLEAGGYLQPLADVSPSSPFFLPLQRIASTGLLKGEGRQVDWTNQFWLNVDTLLLYSDIDNLRELYPCYTPLGKEGTVSLAEAIEVIAKIASTEKLSTLRKARRDSYALIRKYFPNITKSTAITRLQYALLVDSILNPFYNKEVDLEGQLLIN